MTASEATSAALGILPINLESNADSSKTSDNETPRERTTWRNGVSGMIKIYLSSRMWRRSRLGARRRYQPQGRVLLSKLFNFI
jgi:hypothetical protein